MTDFEKRHKGLLLGIAAFGTIPPSLNKLINSKFICAVLHLLSWILFLVASTLTVWLAVFFVVYCRSIDVFLAVFRRWIAAFHLAFKMGLNVLRLESMQMFFDDWNNDEVLGIERLRREEIFEAALGQYTMPLISSIAIYLLGTQGLTYRSAFQPNQLWSGLKWAPHVVAGRYRTFYHLIEAITNASVITVAGCEILRIIILLMLFSQVQNLKELLGKTIDSTPEDGLKTSEEMVKLSTWIKAHQRTLRWTKDIKQFFALELINKYVFLATYSCLAAFCAPRWLTSNYLSFLIGIALFGVGYFSFLFLSSKIIDDISETSERLFEGGYGSQWTTLPITHQNSLKIISLYSNRRPIRFYAFGLYPESKKLFGDILVVAFRVLSVLLQVADN